ncbi:MAG TPA: nicotinate-nucleotide adenylyltransferase [Candidatus Kapabacteria bacterium]|nr:nicotinate-nucleotide adenylyltransferase [Candidatus Kapabacteria bacterium]
MQRIGIFGGSFNPPHVAHLIGAEVAREALHLDKVLLLPASIPPHKQKMKLPDPAVRLRMVEAAVADNPYLEACDLELRREGPSYTVDTLKELRGQYPGAQFVLIIGMDNLEIFHSWRSSDEILSLAELGVMVRPGYAKEKVKPELLEHVSFVEIPLLEISGTEIRKRIEQGLSVRYFVADPVLRIIEAEGLYKDT